MSLLLYTLAVQFVLRKSAQHCVNNIGGKKYDTNVIFFLLLVKKNTQRRHGLALDGRWSVVIRPLGCYDPLQFIKISTGVI